MLTIGAEGVSDRWFTGFVREVTRHGRDLVERIDDGAGITVGAIGLELEDCTTKTCAVKSVTWTAFDGALLPTAMMAGDIDLLPAASFPVETGDLQVKADL